jgi:EAL domain-containing protein (putative c-di-GMP-specific phosphodiesterase class I)/ActR/RegA family two-component response regulator
VTSAPYPVDLRVLVVDDDQFMVDVIVGVLRDAGLTSIEACGEGAAALDHLSVHLVDLLICDLNMPGVDGIRLMTQVASLASRPAVILFSGEDTRVLDASRQFAEAKQLTVLGVLRKPVERDSVMSLLKRYHPADKRPSLSPLEVVLGSDDIRLGLVSDAVHLVYQPIIDLHNGALAGVEGLLRWQDPERGGVPPPEVIRAAEGADLIDDLTLAILSRAVRDRGTLAYGGIDTNIAVNVSMQNLRSFSIVDRMADIVTSVHDRPDRYTLEVTETRLIDDLAQVLEVLIRLRLQGFKIAIDDYGTGAATMQLLMQLPSTELKIDRNFVAAAPRSEQGRALLQSAIELGLQLGQIVVVEGVETEMEARLARELGSHLGQGYLYGRPMKLEELIVWTSTR